MVDRKHTEIFSLFPSVCLSEHFNLDTSAEELIKAFWKLLTMYDSNNLSKRIKKMGKGMEN